MSQSRNPTDTHALLQSMLQRLRLQPGREGQAHLHTPLPDTAAPTWGHDGGGGASGLQKVHNSPTNGFEFGTNGIATKEFGFSAVDGKHGGIQQPVQGCEADRSSISLPTLKGNSDPGEGRVMGPEIPPTGTRQLLPAKSLKDADITSSERADGERMSFSTSAMSKHKDTETGMGESQDQSQAFTPRVYLWSLKPSEFHTGGQEDKVLHVGNGGFGAFAASKDVQLSPVADQKTTNSFRRKQRSSENKTRRWTQKIKERWRDRPGSFGKKGKEEEDQRNEQGPVTSPQNQTPETITNTSVEDGDRSLSSPDSSELSKTPLTHTDDDGFIRSKGDFEFGLGSFSLLEEIVTGQEWAKFLSPSQPDELRAAQSPLSGQPSAILNHQGDVDRQWSFRGAETPRAPSFSVAQASPEAVGMDVSREADQSEAMEHGQNQADGHSEQRRSPSSVQPADALQNSLRSRGHLNRKRQHQSAERREGSMSSQSGARAMEDTAESHGAVMPLYNLASPPPPLSPSAFSPFAPTPKGVLKHSMSQDSEASLEVETKRRRVEEKRRVRFSEDVMSIEPLEADQDATESEEESGADEDSVIDQDCELEQSAMEEAAPARRPVLPAWIRALKRKNTGRKHR